MWCRPIIYITLNDMDEVFVSWIYQIPLPFRLHSYMTSNKIHRKYLEVMSTIVTMKFKFCQNSPSCFIYMINITIYRMFHKNHNHTCRKNIGVLIFLFWDHHNILASSSFQFVAWFSVDFLTFGFCILKSRVFF